MKQENQQPVYDTEEYAYNNIDATWNEAREQRYLNKLVATIEGVEQ